MIKFLFYFSISFILLSIPIKKRQLFYHLDQLATPYTYPIFNKTRNFIQEQLSERKIFGMKIIDLPKSDGSNKMLKIFSNSKTPTPSQMTSLQKNEGVSLPTNLNKKSELLETEYYSESELLQLKTMLKNSDI